MKRLLHISLIVLLSGLPSLFAQNFVEQECCHSKKEKETPMESCCSIEKETAQKNECSALDLASSSFDNCGCIHEYSQIDNSILTNFTNEFSKTLVEIDTNISVSTDFLKLVDSFSSKVSYNIKIPIYISISSYLI